MRRAVRRHGLAWGLTRVLGAVLISVLVLAALGTGFQRLAAERDAVRYPAPGRMVTVEEHRMHLGCIGRGDPTVVLDGGLGEWSLHWLSVQARLARFTRVCSYDRSGYGWSEPGGPPRDAHELEEELHRLLRNGEVLPPYLLVGHGIAGFHLWAYAAAHPERVAGLVLVDTVPPGMAASYDRLLAPVRTRLRQATPAAQFGLLRFTGPPGGLGIQPAGAAYRHQATYPAYYETYLDEAAHLLESAGRVEALPLPPAVPLVVVANDTPLGPASKAPKGQTRERYNQTWLQQQQALVARAPHGSLVTVSRPGANLLLNDPDTVAEAVEGLIATLRAGP